MIESYILLDPTDEELAVSHQRVLTVYDESDRLCYFFSDQVTIHRIEYPLTHIPWQHNGRGMSPELMKTCMGVCRRRAEETRRVVFGS